MSVRPRSKPAAKRASTSAAAVLAQLERKGSRRAIDNMARYGIETKLRVVGVPVGQLFALAKRIGVEHALARELWDSGCYEAQMLATCVADPAQLTVRELNAWTASFDNWAICDTACFKLFDRSPLAWGRVAPWCKSEREFVRRTGFALIACLAAHDRSSEDARFAAFLPLIERGARDERNFVKKGVSWALRGMGHRSPALHAAAVALAKRLARSTDPTERWLGKDVLRDLERPKVRAKLAAR